MRYFHAVTLVMFKDIFAKAGVKVPSMLLLGWV